MHPLSWQYSWQWHDFFIWIWIDLFTHEVDPDLDPDPDKWCSVNGNPRIRSVQVEDTADHLKQLILQ